MNFSPWKNNKDALNVDDIVDTSPNPNNFFDVCNSMERNTAFGAI